MRRQADPGAPSVKEEVRREEGGEQEEKEFLISLSDFYDLLMEQQEQM